MCPVVAGRTFECRCAARLPPTPTPSPQAPGRGLPTETPIQVLWHTERPVKQHYAEAWHQHLSDGNHLSTSVTETTETRSEATLADCATAVMNLSSCCLKAALVIGAVSVTAVVIGNPACGPAASRRARPKAWSARRYRGAVCSCLSAASHEAHIGRSRSLSTPGGTIPQRRFSFCSCLAKRNALQRLLPAIALWILSPYLNPGPTKNYGF